MSRLAKKVLVEEMESLECPRGTDPRVWGNPSRATGRMTEREEMVSSKEYIQEQINEALERHKLHLEEVATDHKRFMDRLYKRLKEVPTEAELLKSGCYRK